MSGSAEKQKGLSPLRDDYLEGRTPAEFLLARIQAVKKMRQRMGNFGLMTAGDIAATVQIWIDQGVITESEVAANVGQLPLDPADAAVFMNEILPMVRAQIRAEDERMEAEAQAHRRAKAEKYCETWGLSRLDTIADYFLKHLKHLSKINPYWKGLLLRYKRSQAEFQEKLRPIEDSIEKASLLIHELYRLTYLYPSEAEAIFDAEQETGTYVYLDSIQKAAEVMYQTATSQDPDLAVIRRDFGSGLGLSVTVTFANDPAAMARRQRTEAIQNLRYGAKTPAEVYRFWKTSIIRKPPPPPSP